MWLQYTFSSTLVWTMWRDGDCASPAQRPPGRSSEEVGKVEKRLYSRDRGALKPYSCSGIVVVGGQPAYETLNCFRASRICLSALTDRDCFLCLHQYVSSPISLIVLPSSVEHANGGRGGGDCRQYENSCVVAGPVHGTRIAYHSNPDDVQ
jgi:hypothetical protein